MDFNNRTNQGPQRPIRATQPSRPAPSIQPNQNSQNGGDNIDMNMNFSASKGKRNVAIILVVVVAIVLVVVGGLLLKQSLSPSSEASIQTDKYQAVFLSNGQVYFGKLSKVDNSYVEISDIYYLQVQQQVQPEENSDSQPKVSLTKLGGELHGPQDQMYVSRDQILFWENLKEDSKVSQAIKDHKSE